MWLSQVEIIPLHILLLFLKRHSAELPLRVQLIHCMCCIDVSGICLHLYVSSTYLTALQLFGQIKYMYVTKYYSRDCHMCTCTVFHPFTLRYTTYAQSTVYREIFEGGNLHEFCSFVDVHEIFSAKFGGVASFGAAQASNPQVFSP